MDRLAIIGVLSFAMCVGGCAAVTKGTSQKLLVNTIPQGADCVLTRSGTQIAKVAPTPGTVEISKSRHDIDVACKKAGYPVARGTLNSELEGMTFGNILIGGLIGVAIDAGTGAMNKYQKTITVPLDPNAAPKLKTVPARPSRPRKPEKPVA